VGGPPQALESVKIAARPDQWLPRP
jgi:hypothetical protein